MKRRFPIAGLLVAAALGGCTNWGADRTDPYGRYFNLGRDAYQSGRWQAAADNLTHYLQAYPSSPRRAEAYYYRGLARVKLERRQAAREDFDRAVHSQPSARVRSLAHVAMGNLHYEEGQDARAVEAYGQGLRSPAPEVPQERVALRLAISLQRLGRWADADRYLAMVIRRYPQTAAAEEARLLDRLEQTVEVPRRLDAVRADMPPAGEQGRNDFRRYLESRVGPGVAVVSSKPISILPLPETEDLRRLTFELELSGELAPLREALENLDASGELLRVEGLMIHNTSIDDRRLNVTITVSTIAREV